MSKLLPQERLERLRYCVSRESQCTDCKHIEESCLCFDDDHILLLNALEAAEAERDEARVMARWLARELVKAEVCPHDSQVCKDVVKQDCLDCLLKYVKSVAKEALDIEPPPSAYLVVGWDAAQKVGAE